MYWHERFTLVVPRELVYHFFPFLLEFEECMAEVGSGQACKWGLDVKLRRTCRCSCMCFNGGRHQH